MEAALTLRSDARAPRNASSLKASTVPDTVRRKLTTCSVSPAGTSGGCCRGVAGVGNGQCDGGGGGSAGGGGDAGGRIAEAAGESGWESVGIGSDGDNGSMGGDGGGASGCGGAGGAGSEGGMGGGGQKAMSAQATSESGQDA